MCDMKQSVSFTCVYLTLMESCVLCEHRAAGGGGGGLSRHFSKHVHTVRPLQRERMAVMSRVITR